MSLYSDIRRDFSFRTVLGERLEHPIDRHTDINTLETLGILWRSIRYIWPFKWRFLLKVVLACGSYLPAILYAWPAAIIVDHVILRRPINSSPTRYPPIVNELVQLMVGMSPMEMMLWLTGVMLILTVLFGAFGLGRASHERLEGYLPEGHDEATTAENAANFANSATAGLYGFLEFRWQLRLTQALNHYYRSQLYNRIKSLPMAILDDHRIGDTVFRVMYDTPSISQICYETVLRIPLSLINVAVVIFLMHYSFHDVPWLVILGLLSFPVTFLSTLPFSTFKRRRQHAARAANAITTSSLEEGMSNILAVQSLGGAARHREIFDADSKESFARFRGTRTVDLYVEFAMGLTGQILNIVTLYVIVMAIIHGKASPGAYFVLWYYYAYIRGSGNAMARLWISLQNNAMGVRRVFFLLDQPAEEDLGTRTLPPIRQGVAMEDVGLVYSDGRRALEHVSFEARVGQVVAIVGPTGAGKTSLAYLIPRFHSATEGSVRIDGIDVNDVTLDSLRSQISYVFQETYLFSDSIAENIRYANQDASDERVEWAARVSGSMEFIEKLPEGFNSRLGRGGAKLSVGQKQRLSIARGLIKDARILIFDEPTSALDPETERHLVHSLEEAAKDRLVLIIAHRLSTIRHADKIVLMQGGRIIEMGTHDELMQRPGGAYRHYVELQTTAL